MCTITDKKPKLRIAEEDIITYKHVILNDCFLKRNYSIKIEKIMSSVRSFEYELNRTYESILDPFISCVFSQGYISKRGFYSYKSAWICNAKCIIPKGSKYYLCLDKDSGEMIYHSDKIKIVEII